MRLPMEDDAARMLPPGLVGNISALQQSSGLLWARCARAISFARS